MGSFVRSLDPAGTADRGFSGGRLKLSGLSPADLEDRRNLNQSPNWTRAGGRVLCYPSSTLESLLLGSPQRRVDLTAVHTAEPQVTNYPASERRIWEVERGRICNAILPMPRAKTLSAGDSIIFALAYSHAGQETCYVKCGDSVCVSLTEVTDLGANDPATGQALYRLCWNPLGQSDSPGNIVKRVVKSRSSHGRG